MVRTILVTLVAVVVAGVGVALLLWLLWWLWSRREEETAAPAIEIEAKPPAIEVEVEEPAVEVAPPAIALEVEEPDVQARLRTAEGVEELVAEAEPRVSELEAEVPVVAMPSAPDDLQRIEGIGPKITSVLQDAGISTFVDLANADLERLQQILEEADPRLLRIASPATWPEQASLAAAGNWDALEALQNELKGGRRV